MTLGPNSRCVFRLTGFNVCWRQLSCGSKVNPNELPLSNDRLTNTMVILGFPGGSDSEESESPAMRETWVRSLGLEDPLEKKMATHSSIHAWKIPWSEEHGLQSMGSQRVRHDWATSLFFACLTICIYRNMAYLPITEIWLIRKSLHGPSDFNRLLLKRKLRKF